MLTYWIYHFSVFLIKGGQLRDKINVGQFWDTFIVKLVVWAKDIIQQGA